ncbi:MAG: NifU family protein [Isosphaeraceae bacterium]|nr:NifU family protein [Isosphaeraceae bacterium]
MTDPLDAREFQARLQRLDALLQGIERHADPAVRSRTREIVQAILELQGAGLERVLGHMAEAGETGATILDACARDEVAGGLLLLHGLHPLDVEQRVQLALEQVRPYLKSHGGNVELLGIHDGVARLRLEGSCHGCPSSALTMKQTIEEAILGRAPDVVAVEVEGETAAPMATPDGRPLVVLSMS